MRVGQRRDRVAPAGGDVLELAVAVELVAEQVAEQQRLRPEPPRELGERRLVRLEQPQLRAAGVEEGGGDAARRGSPPSCSCASRTRGRRISAAIAVVVVLPFVAETSTEPCGSRAASRSIAPGSSFQSSFPGSVVPPPRPASRESEPAARAAAASSASGIGGRIARTVSRTRLYLHSHQRALPFLVWPGSRIARSPRSIPQALAEFQAGIRRRYTDAQILDELRASAERLGRSPTMKEFAADPESRVHPQTVIEHFGTWNAAKRAAGLMPRRFATREELVEQLRALGAELGRTPTADDIKQRRGTMPSASLYWHTFGSLSTALREAGFDVAVGEERLERAIDAGLRAVTRARAAAEVRRLAGGAACRPVDADRMAGLPHVRVAARGLGDVPVPDPRAAARGRAPRSAPTAPSTSR